MSVAHLVRIGHYISCSSNGHWWWNGCRLSEAPCPEVFGVLRIWHKHGRLGHTAMMASLLCLAVMSASTPKTNIPRLPNDCLAA
jgi:hypothetical protein